MSSDIERALIETETWQSIQAQPYDGERYPCGCHPHPKSPHIHFHLCDYHDGFDEGVYQGQRKLSDEIVRLRALVDDYDNATTWYTNCTNCAKSLDDNYDQYCEIECLRLALDYAVRELLPVHDHWGEFDRHEVIAHFLKEAQHG